MVFNSEKFECLRFWPGRSPKPETHYLSPDNTPIEEKLHLRDLGIELSSNLSFSIHIQATVTSATRLIGWAMRTFRRRSRVVMMTIWRTIVQSKLDYCSQLWCPTDQASIKSLESICRQFTSLIMGLDDLDYWERLQELNLYSQERRRERYRIIFIWKCLHGFVDGYHINSHVNPRRGRLIVLPKYATKAPAAVRQARESSLAVHGARLFNIMPQHIRSISTGSVEQFKYELDGWLSTVPDQPTIPTRQRAAKTNSILDQAAYAATLV